MITIIVPFYKTVKDTKNLIKNFKSQTSKAFEVIFVYDNEENKANVEFFKKEIKNDFEYKYFSNKKNMGVSEARNLGIKKSQFDYISFIDADDSISDNYVEKLIDALYANDKSDVIIFNSITINKGKEFEPIVNSFEFSNKKFTNDPEIINMTDYVVWGKLFNKDFIIKNNITFKTKIGNLERFVGEDTLFLLECFIKKATVSKNRDVVYFYNVDDNNSISRRDVEFSRMLERIELSNIMIQILRENKINHKSNEFAIFFYKNIIVYGLQTSNEKVDKDVLESYFTYYLSFYKEIFNSKEFKKYFSTWMSISPIKASVLIKLKSNYFKLRGVTN